MSARQEFEMSKEQLEELMDIGRPQLAIMLHIPQVSAQDLANGFRRRLGDEMGFEHMTVRPVDGKGSTFFTAVVS